MDMYVRIQKGFAPKKKKRTQKGDYPFHGARARIRASCGSYPLLQEAIEMIWHALICWLTSVNEVYDQLFTLQYMTTHPLPAKPKVLTGRRPRQS